MLLSNFIAAAIVTAFLLLLMYLPRRQRSAIKEHEAHRIYLEILHNIEAADYPNDFFWIEKQIEQWESYYMELIDRDNHIRMFNDMSIKSQHKERRLLTNLGIKQLN